MTHPVILKADGTREPFEFEGSEPSLTELQEAVGGTIDIVRLDGEQSMVVHDEGLIRNFKANREATILYVKAGGLTPICGDVVVLPTHLIK